LETAHLVFHLLIEDGSGTTIFQQEKEIRLRLDGPKAEAMRRHKLAFNDFAPLIEGDFRVRLTFTNKTSEEFFVEERKVVVSPSAPSLVLGYQIKPTDPESVLPFSQGEFKALIDPRSIFSRRDSVEGLILSTEPPELFLVDRDEESPKINIRDLTKTGETFRFRWPLADVAPGNYDLVVRTGGVDVYRHSLSVLSFEFDKPLVFERTEPLSYLTQLPFVVGQEYLNAGRADKALESFERLSPNHWNGATVPVIARAYYLQKNYARVLDLLEKDTVGKNYSVLLLLGNSSLELKKLDKAALYFEEIRKFGDTAEANNALGAIYFSLGDKDKAKVYWERAKKLEKKAPEKRRPEGTPSRGLSTAP
jgi:tetratricopeptide (TPR) repeat protein